MILFIALPFLLRNSIEIGLIGFRSSPEMNRGGRRVAPVAITDSGKDSDDLHSRG